MGSLWSRWRWSSVIVGVMLAALAAKSVWCGSILLVVTGFWLLVIFAMTLSGQGPHMLESVVFVSQTLPAGAKGMRLYANALPRLCVTLGGARLLSVLLPAAALGVFGLIFILANPDLLQTISQMLEPLSARLSEWLRNFSVTEVLFCAAAAWVSVGLLRPVTRQWLDTDDWPNEESLATAEPKSAPALLYPAFRNTLWTVILLFAVYLGFEFKTLWFRVFPKGFHYSGYAHEGAAWLTMALGLATVVLSLVFRGGVLHDPRLPALRRLAWIWSVENFVLAAAVYHRLWIYIQFNGMTRMRTVGLFGMTAVVVGFVLVLRKIARNHNFVWLVRRHLWTLALATYLYALTPVDTLVTSYNVRRIMAGDPAPSVQISVHPISSEGVLLLQPLADCDNATIREGLRAILAQRHEQAESLSRQQAAAGWTAYQISDQLVLVRLRNAAGRWADYSRDSTRRETTLREFHDYAFQWY